MTGVPLRVTATLDTPVVGLLESPNPLDGPLAWVMAQEAGNLHLTAAMTPTDYDLPLSRWSRDGAWGWACSRALYEVAAHTVVQVRRRPDTAAMARYTAERRHHLGLGPHKARDTTTQAAWVHQVSWELECTDRPALERLLRGVTHLGRHRGIGYGRITGWAIDPGTEDAWEDRPLPTPGATVAVRPPYWHPATRVTL